MLHIVTKFFVTKLRMEQKNICSINKLKAVMKYDRREDSQIKDLLHEKC